MAAHPLRRSGYFLPQENWDISVLQQVNSQLEMYLKSLPGGSELSLVELQDMASRQQLQIDNQQQVLVAKEQRLKYLKQQEMKHQQISAENERLRKLKEKVESQEMKLKKLRALRGQVEQYKLNNGNMTSELEGIKSLFNEKEKELAVAVAKVEELTNQLESLRSGKSIHTNNNTTAASLELEKLRKELILRNKLNEQQNAKISANREMLHQRKGEIGQIDQRISDLQQRLKKKKAQQIVSHNYQHNDNYVGNNRNGPNIAAVEPYVKHSVNDITKDDLHTSYGFDRQDPKTQTLPPNLKFPYPEKSKGSENRADHITGAPNNSSDITKNFSVPLIVKVDSSKGAPNGDHPQSYVGKSSLPHSESSVTPSQPQAGQRYTGGGSRGGMGIANFAPKPFGTTYSTSMLAGRPFVSSSQPVNSVHEEVRTGGSGQSSPATSDNSYPVSTSAPSAAVTHHHGTITSRSGPVSSQKPHNKPPHINHSGVSHTASNVPPKITVAVPSRETKPTSVLSKNGPTTNHVSSAETRIPTIPPRQGTSGSSSNTNFNPSAKHPMQTPLVRPSQKPPITPPSTSAGNKPEVAQSKPLVSVPSSINNKSGTTSMSSSVSGRWPKPESSAPPSTWKANSSTDNGVGSRGRVPSTNGGSTQYNNSSISNQISENVQSSNGNFNRKPESQPSGNSTSSAQNSAGASAAPQSKPVPRYATKSVIANTYTQKLGSNAMEQYRKNMSALYQGFGERTAQKPLQQQQQNPDASGSGDANKAGATHQRDLGSQETQKTALDVPDSSKPVHSTSNLSQYSSDKPSFKAMSPKHLRRRHSDSSDSEDVHVQTKHPTRPAELPSLKSRASSQPVTSSDGNKSSNQSTEEEKKSEAVLVIDNLGNVLEMSDSADLSVTSAQNEMFGDPGDEAVTPKAPIVIETNKVKHRLKTNLKEKSTSSKNRNRRVSFDPLALLLDASLEGELELVRKTASEVSDVSASNDEGITALHNAICAGHYEIVKFLVEFGADANAPDSDGWTPLHCAASCNNLPMVKLLVDHGACIFATTISDHETAAEKCEEDEDGYDGCSEYLYSIQEKLGIINNGVVYAVFDYKSQNSDELSFRVNSQINILRKGDDKEKEWWWARIRDREGYVPRNLLGLSRRVIGDKGKLKASQA